jgi:hypothetical protein
MLEEALRNEKSHPAETALAMLSFVQSELPAGGTAAESRFFTLYGPLCERIFGPILGPEDDFRHKDGGWLSAQNQWTRPPSTVVPSPCSPLGQQISVSRSTINSLDSDPVVKLLGTAGKPNNRDPLSLTLVEAISKESESRPSVGFAFKFHALPKNLQDAWLVLVEASMGGMIADDACSLNDLRLLGNLLRKRPEEQNQLRLFKQRCAQKQQEHLRQPLHLSPRGFNTPTATTISMKASPGQSDSKAGVAEAPPNVMLSMLEHYLFLFLRFPFSAPDRKASTVSSIPGVNVHRIATPTSTGLPARTPREPFGETLYYHIFRRCMRHFLPYEPEDCRSIAFSEEHRESELFLRILIAMWLESRARLIPTLKVVQTIQERRHRAGLLDDASTRLDLNASYDLLQQQLAVKYDSPPVQVHKCVRTLIIHTVLDPALAQKCLDTELTSKKWCLSTCMTVLQQPFYNYVRTAFRYASIHSSDSPFYGALSSWLIWLEPWNVIERKYCDNGSAVIAVFIGLVISHASSVSLVNATARKHEFSAKNATQRIMGSVSGNEPNQAVARALTIPRYNQASKYAGAWEPYIAANVYMYAVPLAMFLRRARELDFSAGKFERSIEIVKRVFRVFTPEVLDTISRHLDSRQSLEASHLVSFHTEILGPFGPPVGPMSLSSLKADVQSLLEEIDMQHFKKVRELDTLDWLVGKVEGLFGKGVVSGEEKTLETLMERAKLIARLPIDYDILPRKGTSTSIKSKEASDKANLPTHTKDGELSEYGREQLILGAVKCSPGDVPYYGDRMRARIGSHEIPLLVDLTIWASDALNEKFGFTKNTDGNFRVNLRFFADYRNSMFVVITTYLLFKLLW